jgi:hypothetical protein
MPLRLGAFLWISPSSGERLRAMFWKLLMLALLFLAGCGYGGGDAVGTARQAGDRLAGLSPSAVTGVANQDRLTDGILSQEGDPWKTDRTSVLSSSHSYVQYDLGEPVRLRAAMLQADNDDHYVLLGSDDGVSFRTLWDSGAAAGKGMQTRSTDTLDATARHVRLSASGGDGSYSVAEVAVFSERPSVFPAKLPRVAGQLPGEGVKGQMQLFAVAAILLLLIAHRDSPRWIGVLAALPALAGISLAMKLAPLWPFDETVQSGLRAMVSAIAAAALLREYFAPKTRVPRKGWTTAALIALAPIAVGCFYHFGMPQFRDESKHRPTLVHPWDMRVYYPVAKYFTELRFDGLYLASVAAYLDNNPNVAPASVARVRLRDLTNNQMRTVGEVVGEVQAIRQRFTPARWDQFKRDMRYFQDVMGPGHYLGSLTDHGGNATPVWLLVAHLLFRWTPASELTLTLTALLDPLLLGLMFYAIARAFGTRTMLITLIVWGTTELSRFGTNLMGSTLRADWMVALGFAACALKTRRWYLGGALVAYAGLIRAFPAMASFFLAAPALWWLLDHHQKHHKLPGLQDLKTAQMPFLKSAAGVLGCVVVLAGASALAFSPKASWGAWFEKISIHADKPNVNHLGLRNVIMYEPEHVGEKVLRRDLSEPWTDWQGHQLAALQRRKPLYWGLMLAGVLACFMACRKKRLDQAAMIGLLLIPILFYPANYYCHYVFLLPLAATLDRDPHDKLFGWVSAVILGMGVALYPSLDEHWSDICFTKQSWVLLAAFAAIVIPLARREWEVRKTEG